MLNWNHGNDNCEPLGNVGMRYSQAITRNGMVYGVSELRAAGDSVAVLTIAPLAHTLPGWREHVTYHASYAVAVACAEEHATHGDTPEGIAIAPARLVAMQNALAAQLFGYRVAQGWVKLPDNETQQTVAEQSEEG